MVMNKQQREKFENDKLLAKNGDKDAQFRCGVVMLGLFKESQSVVLFPEYTAFNSNVNNYAQQAADWFEKAAKQGHANAQFNLGVMHDTGEGIPQNRAEAIKWYRKAAAQQHAGAIHNLKLIYKFYDHAQEAFEGYTKEIDGNKIPSTAEAAAVAVLKNTWTLLLSIETDVKVIDFLNDIKPKHKLSELKLEIGKHYGNLSFVEKHVTKSEFAELLHHFRTDLNALENKIAGPSKSPRNVIWNENARENNSVQVQTQFSSGRPSQSQLSLEQPSLN
jgi:hypothetical protein